MRKNQPDYERLIKVAEIQYRFANALNVTFSTRKRLPRLCYPDVWTWGKHTVHRKDLLLSRKEEKDGAMFISHSALYVLAVQMDSTLERCFGKSRFSHKEEEIRSASWVVRSIRNAFAHNPFQPVWLIDRFIRGKTFGIPSLGIEFDTTALNGKPVNRRHYGGPLTLLKLSRFVRGLL